MKLSILINSLESKTYYDKDTILLHVVMQLLVDFIEIELAAFYMLDSPPLTYRLYHILPRCLTKIDWIRSRELGLKHLEDLDRMEEPENIDGAKTLKEVYLWWKDKRPNRPDAEDASGITKYLEKVHKNGGIHNDTELDKIVKKVQKIEKKYFDEDTKMLKKIIDIRGYLWI